MSPSRHLTHVRRRASLAVYVAAVDEFVSLCGELSLFQGNKPKAIRTWLESLMKVKAARRRLDGMP